MVLEKKGCLVYSVMESEHVLLQVLVASVLPAQVARERDGAASVAQVENDALKVAPTKMIKEYFTSSDPVRFVALDFACGSSVCAVVVCCGCVFVGVCDCVFVDVFMTVCLWMWLSFCL